jgi:hypothetical protein
MTDITPVRIPMVTTEEAGLNGASPEEGTGLSASPEPKVSALSGFDPSREDLAIKAGVQFLYESGRLTYEAGPPDYQLVGEMLAVCLNASHIIAGGHPSRWQPIETAPKDGTVFLAHYECGHGPRLGPMHWTVEEPVAKDQRFHSWAMLTESRKATHWMQLPPIPQGDKGSEK